MITNTFENLPTKILYVDFIKFNNKIPLTLLDYLTRINSNGGLKHKEYYIINTGNILRYPKIDNTFHLFSSFLDKCFNHGYQLLMIKI